MLLKIVQILFIHAEVTAGLARTSAALYPAVTGHGVVRLIFALFSLL